MKTAGYFITTLLFLATIPAQAQESERVRQIEQEMEQVKKVVAGQEQRVKALEQQVQGIAPETEAPAAQSAQGKGALTQGD